jgi:formamidopyrimidine-DNA glycosylase
MELFRATNVKEQMLTIYEQSNSKCVSCFKIITKNKFREHEYTGWTRIC